MKIIKNILSALALLSLLGLASQAHAELAVIAHPDNNMMGISRDELKDIYLGKLRAFPGGGRVEAVDQESGSAAREQFNRDVLQMTESKRKSYWSRLIFTGKARPPQSLSGDDAVVDWVANNPQGLGYISGSKVSKRVKVLLILP